MPVGQELGDVRFVPFARDRIVHGLKVRLMAPMSFASTVMSGAVPVLAHASVYFFQFACHCSSTGRTWSTCAIASLSS
jgi:hypothetical protein